MFLVKIGYYEELTENICQAIRIHDKWNDVPEDATPFELSVRDADDLDRFPFKIFSKRFVSFLSFCSIIVPPVKYFHRINFSN